MNSISKTLLLITCLCIIESCDKPYVSGSIEHIQSVTSKVDANRLLKADKTPEDWMSYGRNYNEDRFSSLNQIVKTNIQRLGLAWSIELGTTRGIEATPLVVDGIMYMSGPWSVVYAVDARKGEILWTFDPKVPREYGEIACCDVVNRGVALYKGNVYVGSLDGRLIAIDAATGKKKWEVLTVDQRKSYTITGAPRVYDGKVIIGNGGAEFGVRGYVTAYDAATGNQLSRFYTIPGNPTDGFENSAMEKAAETWTGEWWKSGGGGTAWDAMAYDPELKLIYIGVGNGSLWNQVYRSSEGGDNLYLSSIVAIDADSGNLEWYYQTTPGDTWDYTATQHIILADLVINNQKIKALMQAPKNGFFYVIDRANGKLISADPYVYTNWASSVDLETGRPIESDFGRYREANAQISPSPTGGHNWQPMAFNPITNLVYIPARDQSMVFGQPASWQYNKDRRALNLAIGHDKSDVTRIDSLTPSEKGMLIAWNPIEKKEEWRVVHKSTWNAGVMSTQDLVFQGTAEGFLIAYDASTGDELWRFNVGSGVIASPITYMVDGKQYITIVSGWGGVGGRYIRYTDQLYTGAIYTFSLDGHQAPPDYPKVLSQLLDLTVEASKEEIKQGASLFGQYCSRCHGTPGKGGGAMPDLAYSSKEVFEIFPKIVREGTFLAKGMPDFGDRIDEKQAAQIKNYVINRVSNIRKSIISANQEKNNSH